MQSLYKSILAAFLGVATVFPTLHASEAKGRDVTRTIIVPLSPGGAGDKLGRILAQRLSEETGRTYIVENKPGAGGNIAAAYVAKAESDGTTLLMTTGGMLTLNPHIYHNLTFEPLKDFTFIAKWVDSPNILFVRTETP